MPGDAEASSKPQPDRTVKDAVTHIDPTEPTQGKQDPSKKPG